jgi:hypothetical protein
LNSEGGLIISTRKTALFFILIILLPTLLVPLGKSGGETFSGVKDDFYFASGSENDIFAVGMDGNVWHWNGVWWWQVTSGRIIEKRICARSTNEIYGLSKNVEGIYEIVKWNGKEWTVLTLNGAVKDDFYFISEKEIYVIGENNQLYLWDGKNWTKITSGDVEVFDHIQVVSPNLIYGIGSQKQIIKWNGEKWTPVTSMDSVSDFFDVKGQNEIYAIGAQEDVRLWNGNFWHAFPVGPAILRRIFVNSPSEIFGLGSDNIIWQWNGEKWVKITSLVTINSNEVASAANSAPTSSQYNSTFYRVKFLGGVLISQPAILAYRDYLIIAGLGRGGSLYAREWAPLRMESWDAARNGEYEGLTDWYSLEGSSVLPPKLSNENGTVYLSVESESQIVYRKQYCSTGNWSSWEYVGKKQFSPGPFSSNGYTVIPSNHTGYPSQVSLVKFEDFTTSWTKPDWISKLVICEVSTKTFTSPNGPQTGNFKSLAEKMGYLQDLGITAIWLSGCSWGDPRHFGNIYTQYANIFPSLLEPSFGTVPANIAQTEQELKEMVQTAHQRGMKVILDLAVHGVMSYSPLVGANSTLPEYVTPYPTQLSITAHPDWFGAVTNPSYKEIPQNQDFRGVKTRMIDFVGGYEQTDLDNWWVDTCVNYIISFGFDGFRLDLGSSRFDLWARVKEKVEMAGHQIIIFPEGDPDDYPFDIGLYDFEQVDGEWLPFSTLNAHNLPDPAMGIVIPDMKKAETEIFPSLKRQFYTIPISCHDSMAYDLNGSLFEMGYGSFFTPFIPLFMAGEEFNSSLSPVPGSNGLWLLQSELQWNELNNPKQHDFYEAVKKAINLRETESALHYFSPQASSPNVIVVDNFTSSLGNTPSPYIRYIPNSSEAILIVGNSNLSETAEVEMNFPWDGPNLGSNEKFELIDLWSNQNEVVSKGQLENLNVTVASDNFRIFKIVPYQKPNSNSQFEAMAILILLLIIVISVLVIFKTRSGKITGYAKKASSIWQ